jgi:hypothetical protein
MSVYCDTCGEIGSPNDEAGFTPTGGWHCRTHRQAPPATEAPTHGLAFILKYDDTRERLEKVWEKLHAIIAAENPEIHADDLEEVALQTLEEWVATR